MKVTSTKQAIAALREIFSGGEISMSVSAYEDGRQTFFSHWSDGVKRYCGMGQTFQESCTSLLEDIKDGGGDSGTEAIFVPEGIDRSCEPCEHEESGMGIDCDCADYFGGGQK